MEVDKSPVTAILMQELPELVDKGSAYMMRRILYVTDEIFQGAMGKQLIGPGRRSAGGRLEVALVIRNALWALPPSTAGLNPNEAEERAWEVARVVIETLTGRAYSDREAA